MVVLVSVARTQVVLAPAPAPAPALARPFAPPKRGDPSLGQWRGLLQQLCLVFLEEVELQVDLQSRALAVVVCSLDQDLA